jgi:hypothetical protein
VLSRGWRNVWRSLAEPWTPEQGIVKWPTDAWLSREGSLLEEDKKRFCDNPRYQPHAAAHPSKGIRLADQQPLRAHGSAGDAAPREHPHDRRALRREQAAIGSGFRPSPEERSAHDRRARQGDAVASTDLATATKTTLVATSLFAWHSRDQPPDSLMESNPCGRRYKQPTRT